MISSDLSQTVFALPEEDQVELARRIVENFAMERKTAALVAEGVQRIEDVLTGKTVGLSMEEYLQAAE